jgi:hypothetical protein
MYYFLEGDTEERHANNFYSVTFLSIVDLKEVFIAACWLFTFYVGVQKFLPNSNLKATKRTSKK